MICEYTFPVKGVLRTLGTHPIPLGPHEVTLTTNSAGRVLALCIRVKIADSADWPKLTEDKTGSADWNLDIPSPAWEGLRDQLRALEGLLALHGLDEICFGEMSQKWIAESQSEASTLGISELQIGKSPRADAEFPVVGFDVVARSVMAVDEVGELETALSFFRRGRLDMLEERFIEAYYDYFFVIETLFGNGKSKKDALAKEFASSRLLVEATQKVMHGELLARFVAAHPTSIPRLNERYARASPEAVLSSLIETRGFLHHHSSKRPGAWHPEKQTQFECDAIILEEIAFQILFECTAPFIFSAEAESRYRALRAQASSSTDEPGG